MIVIHLKIKTPCIADQPISNTGSANKIVINLLICRQVGNALLNTW